MNTWTTLDDLGVLGTLDQLVVVVVRESSPVNTWTTLGCDPSPQFSEAI